LFPTEVSVSLYLTDSDDNLALFTISPADKTCNEYKVHPSGAFVLVPGLLASKLIPWNSVPTSKLIEESE
jgi:hypothetical protein